MTTPRGFRLARLRLALRLLFSRRLRRARRRMTLDAGDFVIVEIPPDQGR